MIIKSENNLYPSEEKDYIESGKPSVSLFLELKKKVLEEKIDYEIAIKSLSKKRSFYEAYNNFLRYYTEDEEKPLTEAIKPNRKGKSRDMESLELFGKIDFIIDIPDSTPILLTKIIDDDIPYIQIENDDKEALEELLRYLYRKGYRRYK